VEVFAYRPDALLGTLEELAADGGELQDFGHGLLPRLVEGGRAFEHRFDGYWRDLGTPDSFWQAHQDLLGDPPAFDLDDRRWPVRTQGGTRPPAWVGPTARVEDSLLTPGCRVAGTVVRSVLGPGVTVAEGAEVVDAVLFHGVRVGAGARVAHAIVDTSARIGEAATVGGPAAEGGDLALVGSGVQVDRGADHPPGTELAPVQEHPTAGGS